MRNPSKNQVTVLVAQEAKLLPETNVEFRVGGEEHAIDEGKKPTKPDRGACLVAQMRSKNDVAMTTDEIMAMTRGS